VLASLQTLIFGGTRAGWSELTGGGGRIALPTLLAHSGGIHLWAGELWVTSAEASALQANGAVCVLNRHAAPTAVADSDAIGAIRSATAATRGETTNGDAGDDGKKKGNKENLGHGDFLCSLSFVTRKKKSNRPQNLTT
jgi:hypothetical protein